MSRHYNESGLSHVLGPDIAQSIYRRRDELIKADIDMAINRLNEIREEVLLDLEEFIQDNPRDWRLIARDWRHLEDFIIKPASIISLIHATGGILEYPEVVLEEILDIVLFLRVRIPSTSRRLRDTVERIYIEYPDLAERMIRQFNII